MDANRSKFSGVRIVSAATVEAARMTREIVPAMDGQNGKSRIAIAARKLGWKWSRARAVWHGDSRIRLRSEEADQLRAALARKKSEATNDLHQLRSEMARLASLLERIDPDFHSADIDPLRHAVRQMDRTRGRLDRS